MAVGSGRGLSAAGATGCRECAAGDSRSRAGRAGRGRGQILLAAPYLLNQLCQPAILLRQAAKVFIERRQAQHIQSILLQPLVEVKGLGMPCMKLRYQALCEAQQARVLATGVGEGREGWQQGVVFEGVELWGTEERDGEGACAAAFGVLGPFPPFLVTHRRLAVVNEGAKLRRTARQVGVVSSTLNRPLTSGSSLMRGFQPCAGVRRCQWGVQSEG